jgi:hypothetical protein
MGDCEKNYGQTYVGQVGGMNPFEAIDYVRRIYPLAHCKEVLSYGKRGFTILGGEIDVYEKEEYITFWSYTTREQAWIEAVKSIQRNMIRKLES